MSTKGQSRCLLLLLIVAALVAFWVSPAMATYATISITDGSAADWTGVTTACTDSLGDVSGGGGSWDIDRVWVANDSQYLYVRWDIKVANNTTTISSAGLGLILGSNPAAPDAVAWVEYSPSGNRVTVERPIGTFNNLNPFANYAQQIPASVNGGIATVEARFPLAAVAMTTPGIVPLWSETHSSASYTSVVKDRCPDSGFVAYESRPFVISKSGPTTAAVGQLITYTITITNNTNQILDNLTLNDPMLSYFQVVSGLAPGATQTLNVPYLIQPDDEPYLENVVTVTHPTLGMQTATHGLLVGTPPFSWAELTVTKEVSVDGGMTWFDAQSPSGPTVAAGSPLFFRYSVANLGIEPINNVQITSSEMGSGWMLFVGVLNPYGNPGSTWTSPPISMAATGFGQHNNIATAVGQSAGGENLSDTDPAYYTVVNVTPILAIQKIASETSIPVGGTIHYTIKVWNAGSVNLNNVVLTDTKLGINNLPIGTLTTSQNQTNPVIINGSYLVPIADLPGPVVNTATADSDQTAPVSATSTVPIANLIVTKTAPPGPVAVGQSITYSIVVTNNGSINLSNVVISDPKIGFSQTIPSLAAGTSQIFSPSYVVQGGDLPGPLLNTVTADSDQTSPVSASASINIAALSLTKTALEPTVQVGGAIHYTLTVKNEGNVALSNVQVSDSKLGINTLIPALAPGASQAYVGSYQILAGDLPGPVVNTASADSDQTAPVSATLNVPIASLTVTKTAPPGPVVVGQSITYSIVVSNTGSAVLSNVTVSDPKLGFSQIIPSLAAGAIQTFNPSYVVQGGDLPGPLLNTVTADSDQTSPVSASASVNIAALSLIKTAAETSVQVGETIHYTLTVRNVGTVPLSNILVSDSKLGINELIPALEPWAFQSYSGSHLVLAGELPGPVVNTASADSDQTAPVSATLSVPIASLTVTKSAPSGPVAVGQSITYSIVVSNTGSAVLSNVTVSDPKLGFSQTIPSLAAGAAQTFNPSYVVQSGDLPGPLLNTVIANSDQTWSVYSSASVNIAALSLTKAAIETTVQVGESIHYILTIKNEGNVPLSTVLVSDFKLGLNTIIPTIAPGATEMYTISYPVLAGDLPGPVVNTASADSDQTAPVSATLSVPIASLSVAKTAPSGLVTIGQSVTYSIVVSNNGSAVLSNVTVNDSKLGFSQTIPSLAAGATQTFNPSYVVQAGDLPGPVVNTVIADSDQTASVSSSASVNIAAMSVSKTALESVVEVGDEVHYSVLITNLGNVPLTSVHVSDSMFPLEPGLNFTLMPGATFTYNYPAYIVQAGDLPGPLLNTATVSCDQLAPMTDSCSLPIASLTVTKAAPPGPVQVGETITYTIVVSNNGSADLSTVTVNDSKLGFSQTIPLLAAGTAETYSPSYVVQTGDLPGPLVNTVTVDSDQTAPSSAQVSLGIASLTVTKTAFEASARVGDLIHYSLTFQNTGSVPLTNITFVDSKLPPVDPPFNLSLGVGVSFTIDHTTNLLVYQVQAGDLPGPVVNTVTADSDQTDPVSASCSVPLLSLTVQKSAPAGPVQVGQTITYTIVVTNNGSATLTGVAVSDPKIGFSQTIASLPGGSSQTFSPTYTVQAGDLPGPLANTVTADSEQNTPASAQANTDIAALSLSKTALETAVEVGETIHYTLAVKNEGNVLLTNVDIADPKLGIDTTIASLEPGAEQSLPGSYLVQAGDLPGPVVNIAVASSDQTDPVNAAVSVGIYALAIDKSAPAGSFQLGQSVPYQIKVWNAGSADLSNVKLNDAKLGIVDELISGNLSPGLEHAVIRNALYGPISEADLGPNPIHNFASADSDQTDPAVSDSCDVPVAAVKITKSGPETMTIGQNIQYTIRVENLGSAQLQNMLVQDPRIGVSWPIGLLPIGAVMEQQFMYLVKAEDIPGPIDNQATVNSAQTDPASSSWSIGLDPAPRGKMVGTGSIKAGTSFTVDVVSWPGATAPQGNLIFKDISRGISISGTARYVAINPQTKEVVYGGVVKGTPRNAATFKVYLQDGSRDTFKIWLYDSNGNVIYSAGGLLTSGQLNFRVTP